MTSRLALTGGIAVVALSLASPATAAQPHQIVNFAGPVFVQTNDASANSVVAYGRSASGALTYLASYATGGTGGVLDGSVVDHIASQGSVAYDAVHKILLVANAGSNNVSVFSVHGTSLDLVQIVPSGGAFPVSVTTNGRFAYVLDARNGGAIQGYKIEGSYLRPNWNWHRKLGLDTTQSPEFTHTPGQVGFTPSGHQLIVTTKAASNSIDVFWIGRWGWPSAHPVVTTKDGSVPFGFTFDRTGDLAVTETGIGAVTTYAVHADGTISQLSSVSTTQAATCWLASARGFLYSSNAGSGTVSTLSTAANGTVSLLGQTATDAGTVDAASTPGGRYLYVETGAAGIVDEFAVGSDGSLTQLGSVTVPDAVGAEGIVAI